MFLNKDERAVDMPEKFSELKGPRGLTRLAFRLPIWFYRLHLGWILGDRFVLPTHTWRKSGMPHQTVLEVVRYDKVTGASIVASGWGTKSDWFRNVTANPKIIIQIQNKCSTAIAERLAPGAGGRELVNYDRLHPLAFAELCHFMGYRLDGTEGDILALGKSIPIFRFLPITNGD